MEKYIIKAINKKTGETVDTQECRAIIYSAMPEEHSAVACSYGEMSPADEFAMATGTVEKAMTDMVIDLKERNIEQNKVEKIIKIALYATFNTILDVAADKGFINKKNEIETVNRVLARRIARENEKDE